MKAVGFFEPGPIDREDALLDLEIERPEASGQDLLVRVEAVSVNPVDYKMRSRAVAQDGVPVILGYDAVGNVEAIGPDVQGFSPGDRVWYAGAIHRPGTNAEYHLVDARIAAKAPTTLAPAAAAALPLTTLTAYEMLFDRLRIRDPIPGAAPAVLVIGGGGGVGSITIQLVRALTDLTVIATASRPETRDWALELGAHHVIDHRAALTDQVAALGLGAPGFVFSTTHSGGHAEAAAELIAPQGRFGLIDDPEMFPIKTFKQKSVSIHWEFMFTRAQFATADIGRQGGILAEVAGLVDAGRIRSTATDVLGRIDAHTLKQAHALLESGSARGKLVLEGF